MMDEAVPPPKPKKCFLATKLEKETKAIIGLQTLTEFQPIHGNLCEQTVAYYCNMCKTKLSSTAVIPHLFTNMHRLDYMKMNYPDMAEDVKKQTPKSEQFVVCEKHSKTIMEKEGLGLPKIEIDNDYEHINFPKGMKTIIKEKRVEKLWIDTPHKPGDSFLMKILENDPKPIIGLQHITEFHPPDDKPSVINVAYFCNLCRNKLFPSYVVPHIVSIKHRLNYMKQNYPHLAEEIKEETSRDRQNDMCLKHAQTVMEKEGKGMLTVQVDEQRVYVKMSRHKHEIKMKAKRIDNLIDEAVKGEETASVDSPEECFLLSRLENETKPIVGLQFMMEFQPPEALPSFDNVAYYCKLCQTKLFSGTVIAHLLSKQHRLHYLKKCHPKIVEEIKNHTPKSEQSQIDLCEKYSQAILEREGMGLPSIKIDKDFAFVKKPKDKRSLRTKRIEALWKDTVPCNNDSVLEQSLKDVGEPIFGIESITEFQTSSTVVPGRPGGPTLHYFCDLCNVFESNSMKQHILGVKHRKTFIQNHPKLSGRFFGDLEAMPNKKFKVVVAKCAQIVGMKTPGKVKVRVDPIAETAEDCPSAASGGMEPPSTVSNEPTNTSARPFSSAGGGPLVFPAPTPVQPAKTTGLAASISRVAEKRPGEGDLFPGPGGKRPALAMPNVGINPFASRPAPPAVERVAMAVMRLAEETPHQGPDGKRYPPSMSSTDVIPLASKPAPPKSITNVNPFASKSAPPKSSTNVNPCTSKPPSQDAVPARLVPSEEHARPLGITASLRKLLRSLETDKLSTDEEESLALEAASELSRAVREYRKQSASSTSSTSSAPAHMEETAQSSMEQDHHAYEEPGSSGATADSYYDNNQKYGLNVDNQKGSGRNKASQERYDRNEDSKKDGWREYDRQEEDKRGYHRQEDSQRRYDSYKDGGRGYDSKKDTQGTYDRYKDSQKGYDNQSVQYSYKDNQKGYDSYVDNQQGYDSYQDYQRGNDSYADSQRGPDSYKDTQRGYDSYAGNQRGQSSYDLYESKGKGYEQHTDNQQGYDSYDSQTGYAGNDYGSYGTYDGGQGHYGDSDSYGNQSTVGNFPQRNYGTQPPQSSDSQSSNFRRW